MVAGMSGCGLILLLTSCVCLESCIALAQEGQYLYLNCPHINADEWHPFTISSAQDDLYSGKHSITTGIL
jgi:predicted ferric reductase